MPKQTTLVLVEVEWDGNSPHPELWRWPKGRKPIPIESNLELARITKNIYSQMLDQIRNSVEGKRGDQQ